MAKSKGGMSSASMYGNHFKDMSATILGYKVSSSKPTKVEKVEVEDLEPVNDEVEIKERPSLEDIM